MKYAVELKKNGMYVTGHQPTWKNIAIKTAKKEAAKKEYDVFIIWHRSSDGQNGYLNPNGDHSITGVAF